MFASAPRRAAAELPGSGAVSGIRGQFVSTSPAPVPEPAGWAFLLLGATALILRRLRQA
jgi:hypothetical protein